MHFFCVCDILIWYDFRTTREMVNIDVKKDANRLSDIMQSMESAYEYYAKQIGINSTVMQLLQIVYDYEPCTQKQICDIMMIPKQTVNTIVRDYQQKGFLETVQSTEDKRHRHIRLTDQGKDYCEKILPPVSEAENYGLKQFTEEERAMLFSLLEKYNRSFTDGLLQKITRVDAES